MNRLQQIDTWLNHGWLTQLDRAFARWLLELDPHAETRVLLGGALVSRQLGRGEVFLDLRKLCAHPGATLGIPDTESADVDHQPGDAALAEWIGDRVERWRETLDHSPLVGDGPGATPLVLDGERLYLRRFWQHQQLIDQALARRLQPQRTQLPDSLRPMLTTLFPTAAEQPDWQKIACLLALRARFAIITGGPGTGKTTTLTKLLALLIHLNAAEQNLPRPPTILLAAPTGKAAARVSESIGLALNRLDLPEAIKRHIPGQAGTLHRLLGSRPDSRRYRHDRHQPLVADVVVVDEASMIDLEMMAALLDALPDNASLILLGDKDQLASVEAGSVLGDLCRGAEHAAYDSATRTWLQAFSDRDLPTAAATGSALNQQTTMLRHSHRFGADSGIGRLAQAVNAGAADTARQLLNDHARYPDLADIRADSPADRRWQERVKADNGRTPDGKAQALQGYGHYLAVLRNDRPSQTAALDRWAKQVLQAFDTFQVLCALRGGPWGVTDTNQLIERWLFPKLNNAIWYEGRPIMIARNDYNLGLMNGDVGIALRDTAGKLRVVFPHDGTVRWVSPLRLPDCVTAYAMTVHKSQGSEFDHVALILPDRRSPVLTRELVYTAVTRARERFTLLENRPEVLHQAILATCR